MHIRRLYISGYRTFRKLDVSLQPGVTCVLGENNTGKTSLVRALRLALDVNFSSAFRQLTEHDIFAGLSVATPMQVVISVEFTGYAGRVNELALVGAWEVGEDVARLTYRFRPKAPVRDALSAGTRTPPLELDDYGWEVVGGGATDPATLEWNQPYGETFRFSDLQSFQVVVLDALRDVEQDLRRARVSPLERVLAASSITEAEKEQMVAIMKGANDLLGREPAVGRAGTTVQAGFTELAGEAYPLNVKLGVGDPSFGAISRSLSLLLSTDTLKDFETARNGEGLNNLLYISMLVKYFESRIAAPNTAGQLLIIEEPEAHLHPQLQRTLFGVLKGKSFQSLLTTHSTHVSSLSPLPNYVVLTAMGTGEPHGLCPSRCAHLTANDVKDLERYLDSTRSTLLFARRVILVEGPAELFLIPPLVKKVLGIDLDRKGITILPIHGVHFAPYAKLFGNDAIPKRCAIIADGDLTPGDLDDDAFEDDVVTLEDLTALSNDHVSVFQCATTFERALVVPGMLQTLAAALTDFGYTNTARRFTRAHETITEDGFNVAGTEAVLEPLRAKLLSSAKRAGKARFAQVAARHVGLATEIPGYIRTAMEWITADDGAH